MGWGGYWCWGLAPALASVSLNVSSVVTFHHVLVCVCVCVLFRLSQAYISLATVNGVDLAFFRKGYRVFRRSSISAGNCSRTLYALSLMLLDDLRTHSRSLKFVNAATIGLGLNKRPILSNSGLPSLWTRSNLIAYDQNIQQVRRIMV